MTKRFRHYLILGLRHFLAEFVHLSFLMDDVVSVAAVTDVDDIEPNDVLALDASNVARTHDFDVADASTCVAPVSTF